METSGGQEGRETIKRETGRQRGEGSQGDNSSTGKSINRGELETLRKSRLWRTQRDNNFLESRCKLKQTLLLNCTVEKRRCRKCMLCASL